MQKFSSFPLSIMLFPERKFKYFSKLRKSKRKVHIDASGELLDVPLFLEHSAPIFYYAITIEGWENVTPFNLS